MVEERDTAYMMIACVRAEGVRAVSFTTTSYTTRFHNLDRARN